MAGTLADGDRRNTVIKEQPNQRDQQRKITGLPRSLSAVEVRLHRHVIAVPGTDGDA